MVAGNEWMVCKLQVGAHVRAKKKKARSLVGSSPCASVFRAGYIIRGQRVLPAGEETGGIIMPAHMHIIMLLQTNAFMLAPLAKNRSRAFARWLNTLAGWRIKRNTH